MVALKFELESLEDLIFKEVYASIRNHIEKTPDQTFYAIGFYMSYRELDGPIGFPLLAANSLEALQEMDLDCKWNPADWHWNEIAYGNSILQKWEKIIQKEATKSTQSHWFKIEKQFMALMTRVAKKLQAKLKKEKWVTSDFMFLFEDETEGIDLIKKVVPKKLFFKHFPEQDEQELERLRVLSLPIEVQVEYYIGRLSEFDGIGSEEAEEKLIEIGEQAIPILLKTLKNSNDSWNIAKIIGDIGVSTEEVLNTLTDVALTTTGSTRNWCANALGTLGAIDRLLVLSDTKKSRRVGIDGIINCYTAWANESKMPYKLNYAPLEKLLSKATPVDYAYIVENLKPGRSYCEIGKDDITEALLGLKSTHEIIRIHAVCILGDRGIGKSFAKIILPKLVDKLKDPSSEVRRLAVLNIVWWKNEGKRYYSDIVPLIKDSIKAVRETAVRALDEMKEK